VSPPVRNRVWPLIAIAMLIALVVAALGLFLSR
jgi:hypothetical protein